MTSDAQDAIIKQLEDRYDEIVATPLYVDGQTEGHADYQVTARRESGVNAETVTFERKLVLAPTGKIVHDTEEQEVQRDA